VHLKTLSLRGFKSFASATTLAFEPGVTCIVGPNGSGKSNVVDALAWVMGEQGAKSLRGGSMEDVIFAGTRNRAPLGRAEVRLTIDNTDGALPIDYTEVTISRTLFRNGSSEYAINGSACRLLDVQELLSDTGLGREMHVIVGQGKLDAILSASPDERRGFIEEAAGVLKHRKRKERALRKLDTMQGNLVRLTDLTAEIRRRLGPLAKQADVARRAHSIQADVRDARARLLAEDLTVAREAFQADVADETALLARRDDVAEALRAATATIAGLEKTAAEAAPAIAEASRTWFRLSSLRDRVAGTRALAAERVRLLGAGTMEPMGEDPDALEATAARLRASAAELHGEVIGARDALADAEAARGEAESLAGQATRRHAALLRAAADRREGLATLTGQVRAARSKVEARGDEIDRLRSRLAEIEEQTSAASLEFTALEQQIAGVEEGEHHLDAKHEAAVTTLEQARADHEDWQARRTEALRDLASWQARVETLELSLARADGTGALLAEPPPGLLGSLAALIDVNEGLETAIAAVLGPSAQAIVVESVDAAVDAIRRLRDTDAGRAGLLIADDDAPAASGTGGPAPGDGQWAVDAVEAGPAVRAILTRVLAGTVVVNDLARARRVVASDPALVAVTLAGDVLTGSWAEGGAAGPPSMIEVQARFDQATANRDAAQADCERATFEVARAGAEREAAESAAERTLASLHESDARLTAVAEQLGRLGASIRTSGDQAQRLHASLAEATRLQGDESRTLADLAAELERAEHDDAGEGTDAEPDDAEREGAAAAAAAARGTETEARLALRTAEERLRSLTSRVEATQRAAAAEREAREAARERARQREAAAHVAHAVEEGAARLSEAVTAQWRTAGVRRDEAEAARDAREQTIAQVRATVETARGELAELTDAAHRDEMARTAMRLQIDALNARAVDDLGIEPETLLAEFGPHRGVPVPAEADGHGAPGEDTTGEPAGGEAVPAEPQTVPFVRAEQEKRLRAAERALALLGRVNPLALEEYQALEERHRFLTEQLADLKKSRDDLLHIVREVDERVEHIFADAYRDTATAFAQAFARLFPGGEGRLVATDPQNMLTTGVDVEARPAGKSVKRLSLLSGGERALVAVAFVVAIFMARPSPFYVMDEVEAALDEVNLGRLLEIVRELRASSQILVVTHQKRTMEIADALYGVTMRNDGVTEVISQRLREAADIDH
jgi:chromosome segregation protein